MYNGKVVKALLAAKGLKGTQLSNYLFGDLLFAEDHEQDGGNADDDAREDVHRQRGRQTGVLHADFYTERHAFRALQTQQAIRFTLVYLSNRSLRWICGWRYWRSLRTSCPFVRNACCAQA